MGIPKAYRKMREEHPDLVNAYETFAAACRETGPLDERSIALLKLATSLGAGLEGAAHAHTRKALAAGCSPEELLQVATLSAPTVGFPAMMRARGWVCDVLDEQNS